MPRFVILEHDRPMLHWDLMLEAGPVLRTWRLSAMPRAGEPISAMRAFDHRLLYLDYEGPIHGDRGWVIRREYGLFSWQLEEEDQIEARLEGERLRGVLRLVAADGENWRGEFVADQERTEGET